MDLVFCGTPQFAVPTLAGSLDLFHSFDAFKGDGSYFAGLQAGYNFALPSRLLAAFPPGVPILRAPLVDAVAATAEFLDNA